MRPPMTEEDILLHTFRTGEEIEIEGYQLQKLLQHKNQLIRQLTKAQENSERYLNAMESMSNKLDSINIVKSRKASIGVYVDHRA